MMKKFLDNFISGLPISLVVGFLSIIFSISFASIIFAGPLEPYLASGIGIALLSCIVLSLVIPKLSRIPDVIAQPQHVICILIALMAGSIATNLHQEGHSEQILPTVIALIGLSAISLGVFFITLGFFHWGRFIRYIPYPVIGGVIAGIGWLIIIKSIEIMTNMEFNYTNLLKLTKIDFFHALPGILFGILLYMFSKRDPLYAIPILLVAFLALFYFYFWFFEIPFSSEWLIAPLPKGRFWPPLAFKDFAFVNWQAIGSQTGHLVAMLFTGVVYYLFTASGLEVITKKELNIDRELQVSGLANLLAGFGGGIPGYQTLMLSSFSYRMGANNYVGIICALIALAALFSDLTFLSYLPKMAMGGLVFVFGLFLFMEWAFSSRHKVPTVDYILILVIAAIIAFFGFMAGVFAGMAIAVVIFVVDYSRINVVKYTLFGDTYQSNVDRPLEQQHLLREKGNQIFIIKLQGYLFFGTAYNLLEKIKAILEENKEIKYLILDFRLVFGLDTSAINSFVKIVRRTKGRKMVTIFTDVKSSIRPMFERVGIGTEGSHVLFFDNLDYGFEWCEDQILKAEGIIFEKTTFPEELKALFPYFEKIEAPSETTIIQQGDPSNEIYLIESGRVSVFLQLQDGRSIRLRTMEAGTFIGELGFYLGTPRATSVIALKDTVLYCITKEKLSALAKENPELILLFHESVARNLAERVVNDNKTVQALLQ